PLDSDDILSLVSNEQLTNNIVEAILVRFLPAPTRSNRHISVLKPTFLNNFQYSCPERRVELLRNSPITADSGRRKIFLIPYLLGELPESEEVNLVSGHWVLLVVCWGRGMWSIMDSLNAIQEGSSTWFQIGTLLGQLLRHWGIPPTGSFQFHPQECKYPQRDGTSCGLYVIEHILEVMESEIPGKQQWDPTMRRREYYDALEDVVVQRSSPGAPKTDSMVAQTSLQRRARKARRARVRILRRRRAQVAAQT
ncbi:hypothetical protein B0J14DRAFT_325594, partial [Halenospora varia]